jgi:hypothetical protein
MPKRLRSEEGEEGGGGHYSGLVKNHISEREVNAGILQVQDKKFNCKNVN